MANGLSLGGPLAAFGIGKEIGAARSPVNGIGQAIRNLLDDAKKKGILQAQSQFQGEASNQVNIAKEGRAATRATEQIPLVTIGPGGRVDDTRTIQRGSKVIAEPSQSLSTGDVIQAEIDKQNAVDKQNQSPFSEFDDRGGSTQRAIAELQKAGIEITSENVAEAIRQIQSGALD